MAINCFVCNLPILSHQVGLVWQGGNGVDDLLREQMEMDIVRGRLGGCDGRRDSSAQITTIETMDMIGDGPPGVRGRSQESAEPIKRRRSSLAQLTDLLREISIGKEKYRSGVDRGGGVSGNVNPRRGTLADLGRSFGGVGSSGQLPSGQGRRSSARPSMMSDRGLGFEVDFLSKVRKRRETSADITIIRKGSGCSTGMDTNTNGSISSRTSDFTKLFSTSSRDIDSSDVTTDSGVTNTGSRRGSVEIQQILEGRKGSGASFGGPLKLFRRRESRGMVVGSTNTMTSSPISPEASLASTATETATTMTATGPPPTCLVRMPSSPGHQVVNSFEGATAEAATSSSAYSEDPAEMANGNRRESLKLSRSRENLNTSPNHSSPVQLSPTGYRRGLRRQSTAYEEGVPIRTAGVGLRSNPCLRSPLASGSKSSGTSTGTGTGTSSTPFDEISEEIFEEEVEEVDGDASDLALIHGTGQEFVLVRMVTKSASSSAPDAKRKKSEADDKAPLTAQAAAAAAPAAKRGNNPSGSRRGSRPFLSPDVSQQQESVDNCSPAKRPTPRRDSLSPDISSATDEGIYRGRRDSRPLLSPEPDGGMHSRDGSPRPMLSRGAITRRRSSGMSEDGGKARLKSKPYPSGESSSAHSSREHSPKETEGRSPVVSGRYAMRRQSTTEEILIARGFRRESTTEDIMRCRNFRRSSANVDPISRSRGRRDSCTQITDGQVETMTIESERVIDAFSQQASGHHRKSSRDEVDTIANTTEYTESAEDDETPSLYENNHYHEECLKCNSCGMNLSGPNQKRARRFKNQILCDLHFADMALMESSDFMQQLRNFKPQSLGCAVARRKSSATLIFPLPPQACSDEFCDGYPHNVLPTPGYWIECSRAISNQGSAWTNEDRDLHEVDEGITDSPDGSIRDTSDATDKDAVGGARSKEMPEIREPRDKKRKTPVEEQWDKYGQFGLTSVEHETHEKYFYAKEHWNYFTNDEDLGPVILSLKQENINGRDQFRVLVRAVSYTIHGLIPASCVFADRYNREEVVASLGREINLNPPLTLGQLSDTSEELLKLDQVFIKSELKVGVVFVKENQFSEEEILANNDHSANFDEFLTILGEKVRLKGFDRYKGGLDTVHDLTGLYSVFTHWRGIEIMFHVSTLLPFEQNDPQKLQRKRHIGNDIVCVVFLEADNTPFSPACIKSHFLHTFVVVRCSPKIKFKPTRYEISVVTRDEVGAYKPYLWEQSTFNKGPMFREWLLTKIVNAERASYSAPNFARMQERTRSQMLEDLVANLQNHAETGQIPKPYRRGSWRPIGHMRPSSPLLDSVRDLFEGQDQMAKDFARTFKFPPLDEAPIPRPMSIYDVTFLVGQGDDPKVRLYGVRAILGVRSRVFQELLYGISTGFGSPQLPVAEILARAVPTLHPSSSGAASGKSKSSNFLQVPDIEGPRPKSVPNSPSIPRAFSSIRNQLSTAWGGGSSGKKKEQRLSAEEKKKWASSQDCSLKDGKDGKGNDSVPTLAVPRLSVCADAHKVDRTKLAQTEFAIIEFDGETFRLLLTYLHTGSCPLSCTSIPGLICSAEHYDLPELLQACFHHAKQFIKVPVCCQMLSTLENYYWRYTSASELVNMILAYIETRALAIFHDEHFPELSESMVQMIMNRNLEVTELAKFEAMLKWAKVRVKRKCFSSRVDAKIEYRCCMDRLTRDLKLYRIPPHDLIRTVLPSKAIRNEKILETLVLQANSGMYRIKDSYLEACQRIQKQDSRQNEWESFECPPFV